MAKSYTFLCKTSNIKYGILAGFKQNKFLFVFSAFVAVLGLITGIFVALKCGVTLSTLGSYNLNIYPCENVASFAMFVSRLFSCFCVLLILTVSSLYVLLIPIGFLIIGYRSYLIGFNCTLLICLFGISGAINSVLVIFPCQLLLTLAFVVYFVLMINRAEQRKRFGQTCISFWKIFFIFFGILFFVCLTETFLLLLFNANTILVI